MKKFKKLFLSTAMLGALCVLGSNLTTHAATDGLVENFNYSTDEITIGGTSNYNIYSKSIIAAELAQEDELDTLKLSHQPGELSSTGGKVEFRDNGGASSLFNQEGKNIVVKIKFKMNQTEDKSIKFWFGKGDVNADKGFNYNMLRMRYNETRYQMGSAAEVTDKSYVVTSGSWHEAKFVLYETGELTQDKVYTYVDDKLIYSADFNVGDDFNGKLTGITIEWPKGNYGTASNMFLDYISVQEYNGATVSLTDTKNSTVGEEFELAPTLIATNEGKEVSIPDYKVTVSDTSKLSYNEETKKFTALAQTTDPVTVTYDFLDELIQDKVVNVTIAAATEPIKVASINQTLFKDDIALSKEESFNLDHLFKASPTTADNTTLSYEIMEGNDIISIENNVITGLKEGTATIKVASTDGSNIEKNVNVTVLKGAYQGLNNYELTDLWEEAEQTRNGFISKGYGSKTFAKISVVEDEIFGKAIKFEGNGGANSSGSHLDKHIPLSQLAANKDFKLTGWVKLNSEAATKTSQTRIDAKIFTYFTAENGKLDYGKVSPYKFELQNQKPNLVDGWIYFETNTINLDVNAINYQFEGIKIEIANWNSEAEVEAYVSHLSLVEVEGVKTEGWDITNENHNVIDPSKELSLQAGTEYKINAVPVPSAGSITASFVSSDESIATVDADGLVTILDKVGTVKITVTVGTDKKEITINVSKKAQSITMDSASIEIILNKFDARRAVYNITVSPADSSSELEAIVANTEICTASIVGNKLYITNPALGTTTITISAKDNSEATFELTILVKEYTISFNVQGHGTAPDSLQNVLAIPETLPTLSVEGYVFGGWFTDSECKNAVVAGAITQDVTLYAKWTAVYTIVFDVQGHGTAPDSILNVSSIPETLPTLSAEGYVFGGWFTDSECQNAVVYGSALSANITLYAKWVVKEADKFTVSYDMQGHGNAIQSVVNATALPETLPTPTAEGYKFEGWYLDKDCKNKATAGTEITADTTLYAKWMAVYTVSYDVLGHGNAIQSVVNVTALPETLPTPTAEGYKFEGWYLDKDCKNKATAGAEITADTTLYAKWTEIVAVTYTITYNAQGHGTAPQAISGTKLPNPLPELSVAGYTFGGWYLDKDCKNKATAGAEITADTTLYAKWTENAPKPSTPEPTDNGLSGGAIAAIVIGAVGVVGVAGGVTYYLLKKKKSPKTVENKDDKE